MSSPERLHELMPLVSPLDWMLLLTLAVLLGSIVVWSLYGRVPQSVNARGVFVQPSRIVEWQAPADGNIVTLNVRAGQPVRRGSVLGYIDQSEIRKRLEQNRAQLEQLITQDRLKTELASQETALMSERADLERKSIRAQRENLLQTKQMLERMAPLLADRLRSVKQLQQEKLLAAAAIEAIEAERASLENTTRMTETQAKVEQLTTAEKDLEQQLEKLRQTQTEADIARKNAMQQLSSQIAVDEVALQRSGELLSNYTGKVVELLARTGQFVTAGSRLASIELTTDTSSLDCLLYVPVRNGKRIYRGMEALVTPDVVERERFGGIIGKVVDVSAYAVTVEGAATTIGSMDIARSLVSGEPSVEVRVALQPDPNTFSSYEWSSSQGPPVKISAGTTNAARIVVEREPAINYLLPFLRSLSGIH